MSLIKKGFGKSMELSKNTLGKFANALQENKVAPYSISITTGMDATKLKPYYIGIKVIINDRIFKKRMNNIFKEHKYRLCYKWYEENAGTFFNPKYDQHLKLWINAYPSKTEAMQINIVTSIITLGAVDDVIDFSNTYKLKDLNNFKIYFENEKKQNLFSQQLEKLLVEFYQSHYAEYNSLNLESKS